MSVVRDDEELFWMFGENTWLEKQSSSVVRGNGETPQPMVIFASCLIPSFDNACLLVFRRKTH